MGLQFIAIEFIKLVGTLDRCNQILLQRIWTTIQNQKTMIELDKLLEVSSFCNGVEFIELENLVNELKTRRVSKGKKLRQPSINEMALVQVW